MKKLKIVIVKNLTQFERNYIESDNYFENI